PAYRIYYELKARSPKPDWVVINLDGAYWHNYLAPLNKPRALLSTHPPATGPARDDWETYIRNDLNLAFIQVSPQAAASFRTFLRTRFANIDELNKLQSTHYRSFDEVPIFPRTQVDFSEFIKSREFCPIEYLSVYGARQAFQQFLIQRHGAGAKFDQPLPIEQLDYADFLDQKSP